MNPTQPCRLLSIPAEIRLTIYEALLAGITEPKEARQLTALLKTCKMILREATTTFMQHCKQQMKIAANERKRAWREVDEMRVLLRRPSLPFTNHWHVASQYSNRIDDWMSLEFDVFKQEIRRGRSSSVEVSANCIG